MFCAGGPTGSPPFPPFSVLEVLPIEQLLRSSWNSQKYMQGADDPSKPFLVEECSKAHLLRIQDLMRDDNAWASISMIALLSSDADHIGSWAEACSCHPPEQPETPSAETGKHKRMHFNKEARACPFRCCRAPELAVGRGISSLCQKMIDQRGSFNAVLAKAPASKRSELASSWTMACSKLFGYSIPMHSAICH